MYLSTTLEKLSGDFKTFKATQIAKTMVTIKITTANNKAINVPKPMGFVALMPTKLLNSEKVVLTTVSKCM